MIRQPPEHLPAGIVEVDVGVATLVTADEELRAIGGPGAVEHEAGPSHQARDLPRAEIELEQTWDVLAVGGEEDRAPVGAPARRHDQRALVAQLHGIVHVEGEAVDLLQAAPPRADEGDRRVEGPALAGQELEDPVGGLVRHAREVSAPARESPARRRHVVATRNVEETDLDRDRVTGGVDGALDERLGTDRRPPDEVDVGGRRPGGLRVLDERLRIEQAEVPREVEVAGEHAREARPEAAIRVAADVLERHDGDRKRLAARPEDRTGHDRVRRAHAPEAHHHHREHGQGLHPAPCPPCSSEWNSIWNSRNSFT